MQGKQKKRFDLVRRQKAKKVLPTFSVVQKNIDATEVVSTRDDINFFESLSPEEKQIQIQRIRSKIFQNTQRIQEAEKRHENIERILIAKGKKREELQYEMVSLVEAAAGTREEALQLFRDIKKSLAQERRKFTRLSKKIEIAQKREKDIQDLVLGLKIRKVKNRIEYFSWFRRLYDRQLQIKIAEQHKLERDISVLQARYHGVLFKIQASEREEEKKIYSQKRRGRVVAGADLATIASHLEKFQVTTNQLAEHEKIVQSKKEHIRNERKRVLGQLSYLRHKVVSLTGKIDRRYEQIKILERNLATFERQIGQVEKQKQKLQELPKVIQPKVVKKTKPLRAKRPVFNFNISSLRKNIFQPAFVSFMIFAVLVTSTVGASKTVVAGLKMKQKVLGESTVAYDRISDARTALEQNDLSTASTSFQEASSIFADAAELTNSLSSAAVEISGFLPQTSALKSGSSLLTALHETTAAATSFTEALNKTQGAPVIAIAGVKQKNVDPSLTLTDALSRAHSDFSKASESLSRANEAITDVRLDDVPENLRDKVEILQQGIPVLAMLSERINSSYDTFLALLGSDHAKRYLILFQNHTELRASGGFLGTFALVDIDQGKVTQVKTNGIYDLDGQLAERIVPPYPLRLITDRWFTRDTNWYPDFPMSAKKISEFFEKSGGPSFDGVIAFDPTIVQDLLRLTGPITMKKYNATVTADNFIETTQYEVEKDYDKKLNKPKQFLADLVPVLLSETLKLNHAAWPDVLSVLLKAAGEKHFMAYSSNDNLQKLIEKSDIAGEMKYSEGDYLAIINSNILGNKTDAMIHEDIEHTAIIQNNGTVQDTVRVTRDHTGTNKWPSGTNRDYVRIYVPKGSTFVSAEGFSQDESLQKYVDCNQCSTDPLVSEIESTIEPLGDGVESFIENGFTVFAGWQILEPGKTKSYSITYTLPQKIQSSFLRPVDSYRLHVQKQAGSLGSLFQHETKLQSSWQVLNNIVDNKTVVSSEQDVVRYETTLTTDKFFSHIIEKK